MGKGGGYEKGGEKGETSHPRIAHGQRFPIPCLELQVKKWSESRAAAPKGRCPVGHRGEFPDVLRRNISGLRRQGVD